MKPGFPYKKWVIDAVPRYFESKGIRTIPIHSDEPNNVTLAKI